MSETPTKPLWLSADQAAALIQVSAKTLEAWRAIGKGPRFVKAGRRCLYREDWLGAWLESRAVSSVAEARQRGLL